MTSFHAQLRQWRTTRRYSQARLAAEAEISTRHLSFLETGKAQPSRQMVLLLGSALDLDLRARNTLLLSAGFAPLYSDTPLDDSARSPMRRAIDLLLQRQEPYGAVVVDRLWNLVTMNRGALRLMQVFMPTPPDDPRVATNLLHALLHPQGLRPYILNWQEVAWGFVARLHREHELLPDDPKHRALMAELYRYPGMPSRAGVFNLQAQPFLTVHLRRDKLELSLFTVLSSFGTPLDVTAQELTVETWFPADEASDRALHALAQAEN